MANKPADRTAEAFTAHNKAARKAVPLSQWEKRNSAVKKDVMHVYVDGKHKITVDASKAREVAETYMREGSNVWTSRKLVTL